MKNISFEKLQDIVSYNDYTAFVYDDGAQVMYSGGEITDDSLSHFEESEDITICNMGELPRIKEIMQANLLAELEPADNVVDEGYEAMKADFANNKGDIAFCKCAGKTTYMLIW